MPVVVAESVEIDATPERVYESVSDVSSMPRWSPECERVTVRGGSSGPTAVGTRFTGRNRTARNLPWSTSCVVTVATPGEEFTFDVRSLGGVVSTWRYTLTPLRGGRATRVTESCVDLRGRVLTFLGALVSGVTDRDAHNPHNMRTTLERLKAHLESGADSTQGARHEGV